MMEITSEEYAQATHDRDEGIFEKCLGCLFFEAVGMDCCYSSEGHCDRKKCEFYGPIHNWCDHSETPSHSCRYNCLNEGCPLDD